MTDEEIIVMKRIADALEDIASQQRAIASILTRVTFRPSFAPKGGDQLMLRTLTVAD
jgi:hypothetical protein